MAQPGPGRAGRTPQTVQWMARPLGPLLSGGYTLYTCPGVAGAQGMVVLAARAAFLTLHVDTQPSPCTDKFLWLNWSGTRHVISSGLLKID